MTRQVQTNAIRPAEVRETLRRQIGDASRTLREPGLDDEGIHKARKNLKRARANLRLLREVIGEPVYLRANAALRDAARPLSSVRDAKVMVDTLDALLEREQNSATRALLVKLHGMLEEAGLAARGEMDAAGAAAKSAAALDEAWRRAERWRVSRKSPALLRNGLKRIYRSARKALASVRSERSAQNLHEWRKQVKYLTQAMESLQPHATGGLPTKESLEPASTPGPLRKLIETAEVVADCLGKDHDLVVLQERVMKLHASSNARAALFTGIAERRKKLQSQALKRGRALFGRKPKAFVRALRDT
jgi:CHAD domain-containing protein